MSYGLLLSTLLVFFNFSYKWIKYDKTYESILNAISIVFYSITIFFLWSFPLPGGEKLFVVLIKFYFLYIQKHVILGRIRFQNWNIQSRDKWNFLSIFNLYFCLIQFFCFYLVVTTEIFEYPSIIEVFTTDWFGPYSLIISMFILINQFFVTWIEKRDRKRKSSIAMLIMLIPAFVLSLNIVQEGFLLYFLIISFFGMPFVMGIIETRFLNMFLKGITSFDIEISKTMRKLSKNSHNKEVQMNTLIDLIKSDETLEKYLFGKFYFSFKKRKVIKELKIRFNQEERTS